MRRISRIISRRECVEFPSTRSMLTNLLLSDQSIWLTGGVQQLTVHHFLLAIVLVCCPFLEPE